MDLSGLFKKEYLKEYNETAGKSWKTTVKNPTKKYNR